MILVDTNYFIRFIENDNEKQVKIVQDLFLDGIQGIKKLTSTTPVFFEIYWLMKSFYNKQKKDLERVLKDVLDMNFINWQNGETLTEAVEIMKNTGYDLEDAYNLIYCKKNKAELATFDKKLTKNWERIKQDE
ncbi:MAG: hypothetical protein UW68_C0033G0008 [Candidatus Collierbacteria bacterium GW2011_GWB1_44_6]|uniref:PIN domain-containing protein n=1 Tax=Candidatus Collierbacteria bacterium GW2011_GWB1_44_6 TaxID=1618384 RepID=A0A0G1JLZ6_9BACT|nr:MAG: hypothetical protein UW68_C0033G0008 [Candidatus Collierbacteria bacterium GW2011_GWB1_44_6]KKT82829.1 MAG: PilT protein domain protein [Microgenomates group bacterium GW2011_GWC1_44_9]